MSSPEELNPEAFPAEEVIDNPELLEAAKIAAQKAERLERALTESGQMEAHTEEQGGMIITINQAELGDSVVQGVESEDGNSHATILEVHDLNTGQAGAEITVIDNPPSIEVDGQEADLEQSERVSEAIDELIGEASSSDANTQETEPSMEADEDIEYIDKLTTTPLPAESMKDLLSKLEADYTSPQPSAEQPFELEFIKQMQDQLNTLIESGEATDNITFDDLSWHAEDRTGMNGDKGGDVLSSLEDQQRAKAAVEGITNRFGEHVNDQPDLKQIRENIDQYTVHPGVHGYEGTNSGDRYGEEYGSDGRWVPEKRDSGSVWVSSETVHDRAQNESDNPTAEQEQSQEDLLFDSIPDTARERRRFARENFTGKFDINKTPLLTAFLKKELIGRAESVPEGSRYPDTVGGVVGNGGDTWHYLKAVLSTQEGRELNDTEFTKLSFSEVAKKLGFNVEDVTPDYSEKFRVR